MLPILRKRRGIVCSAALRTWAFTLLKAGGSALFVIALAFVSYSEIKSAGGGPIPWATLEMWATIAFGIPLVVLILGWAFFGSAAKRP